MIRLTSYAVIAEKPRVGQLSHFFSLHPVGKILCVGSKNDWHLFNGFDELYHHAKFGEDRTMRAGCRCENVLFVFLFLFLFVCHAPSPEHRAFEGRIVRTSIALPFIARFRRGFQRFFLKGLLF